MPSKKRKYNARFPAGRIKKIMQTDEEVGKVAQAVPVIISRTLELFVESLLSKAMQVTLSRNAKTLSPSHVKQCILAESRFDFLRDLVKNVPDVSAAEEKELQMATESSPNSSRFSDTSATRRIVREDSNSSSSSDVRIQLPREPLPRETVKRALSADAEPKPRVDSFVVTSTVVSNDAAIDLSTKKDEKVVRTANFYQETLLDQAQHRSVITVNPTYSCPQPSTSNFTTLTPVARPNRTETSKPDNIPHFFDIVRQNNNIVNSMNMTPPRTPLTPNTPIINIDLSNLAKPEIKVIDPSLTPPLSNMVKEKVKEKLQRQNSKSHKEARRDSRPTAPVNIDLINSGNLQIDEDYDT